MRKGGTERDVVKEKKVFSLRKMSSCVRHLLSDVFPFTEGTRW